MLSMEETLIVGKKLSICIEMYMTKEFYKKNLMNTKDIKESFVIV